MNPSKRRIRCSNCHKMEDAEEVVCKDCIEKIRSDEYACGYGEGQAEGEKKGYAKGEEIGREEGYQDGYKEAVEEGEMKNDQIFSL